MPLEGPLETPAEALPQWVELAPESALAQQALELAQPLVFAVPPSPQMVGCAQFRG